MSAEAPWIDTSLGRPLADEVHRERLITRLADRWTHRLLTVQAPGGYGKSVALAQAIRDNRADPTGIDVHVRCRRPLDGLAELEVAIAQSFGAESTPAATVDELAKRTIDLMSDASPQQVCLCFDEVHVMAAVPEFAELLDLLVDQSPTNAHLMLVGRSLPALRTAKLRAADDIVAVDQDELLFDDDELGELAARHGVPAAQLASGEGWPAVSRLLVVAGRDVSIEFMIEEVVTRLSDTERTALALAVIAAPATGAMVDELAPGVDVRALVHAVPLMSDHGDGSIAAHDLWHDVRDSIIGRDEQIRLTERVIGFHEANGEYHRAVDVALQSGVWTAALSPMMQVLGQLDVNVDQSQIERWRNALPDEATDTPAYQFLTGLIDRLAGGPNDSIELIRTALDGFEREGDLDGATTAVLELGLRSWMLSDEDVWAEVSAAGARIVGAGGARMARVAAMSLAVDAERRGDFAAALDVYESIGDRTAIESGHAWMLAMLHGDLDRALGHLGDLVDQSPRSSASAQILVTQWEAGNPQPMLTASVDALTQLSVESSRDAARRLTAEVMIGANRGVQVPLGALDDIELDDMRKQGLLAVTRAAHDLFDLDQSEVGRRFDACLDEVGWDDPQLRGEIRRYLPYPYVLSTRCRDWLDGHPSLGPVQVALRDLARALIDARNSAPITSLPPPESVLTWLPLPWSVELAVRLVDRDDQRGLALLETLSDVTGAAAHNAVRRLRTSDDALAPAASRVLAQIPGPPTRVARLRVCDDFELRHDGAEPANVRLRVRQLLTLLTLRHDWTRRQLSDALWPGDETRARNNLRTTLSHVRQVVEPDRGAGEASFTLRQRGDRVWLQRSDWLDVDLWDIERQLDEADADEALGNSFDAVTKRRAALERWTADSLNTVDDVLDAHADVEARRRRVLDGGAWASERLLANGQTDASANVAAKLLQIDSSFERAHAVSIGAALGAGDLERAGTAVDALEAALASLGVEQSAGTSMLIRRYERRRAQHAYDAFGIAETS